MDELDQGGGMTAPPQAGSSTGGEDSQQNALYSLFDQEEKQEQDVVEGRSSFIASVNADLFKEREREYRDIEKHWVRTKVWLRAAKQIAERKGSERSLRYLTLPAYYRIDVSLLLREQLIQVTQTGENGQAEEIYVAAFETDPTKYGRMSGQTPSFKLFGRTEVEKALTDPSNPYYRELQDLFPFDVVNLDLTTSLTPRHEGPYTKTMEAIETIFRRQAGACTNWALFLTVRNMPVNWQASTIDQLYHNLQQNLDEHPKVLESFSNLYHVTTVAELVEREPKTCISQSVLKWIVDRSHHHNFKLDSNACYRYVRKPEGLDPYDIYKHVLVFSEGVIHQATIPTKGIPTQSWMIDDLASCVEKHKCKNVQEEIKKLSHSAPHVIRDLTQDIDVLCRVIDETSIAPS